MAPLPLPRGGAGGEVLPLSSPFPPSLVERRCRGEVIPIIGHPFLAFFSQFPIIASQFPISGRPFFPLFLNFLSSRLSFLLFFSISCHRVSVSYHRSSVFSTFSQFPIIASQFPIIAHPFFPLFLNFLSTVIRFFHFFSISYHRVSISYHRSSDFSTFIQFPITAHPFFSLLSNFQSSRFNFLSTVSPIFCFFSISNPRSSISCPTFRFPLSHFIISSLPLPSSPIFPSHTYIYSIVPATSHHFSNKLRTIKLRSEMFGVFLFHCETHFTLRPLC